jgi:hypothetical protein
VHLEPDAVAEAVEEAAVENRPGRLRELCRVTVRLEEVGGDLHQVAAVDAGLDSGDDAVEGLLAEPVPVDEVGGRLADAIRARHVRVDAARAVAREQVDDDRPAGPNRAVPELVADRGLRTV